MPNDWLVWQLIDSAFPAGGFAHSGGLEAAWQCGLLRREDSLDAFIRGALRQAARMSGPLVAAVADLPEEFLSVDALADVLLSSHVANRASRAQGQAILTASTRIFSSPGLVEFAAKIRAVRSAGHFAPVFGGVCGALAVPKESAVQMFLFLTMRSMLSAAVRLGLVGPLEAQSIQSCMSEEADACARIALSTPIEEATQSAPLLEIAQAGHDRLYSRLFQS